MIHFSEICVSFQLYPVVDDAMRNQLTYIDDCYCNYSCSKWEDCCDDYEAVCKDRTKNLVILTAHKRSCEKVIFLVMCVNQSLTVHGTPLPPLCQWHQEGCSWFRLAWKEFKLVQLEDPFLSREWHQVATATHSISKWVVCILLECFLFFLLFKWYVWKDKSMQII